MGEYDLGVCEILREKILIDHGNPSIKEKVLDLLTKLERESREMAGHESPAHATITKKKNPSPEKVVPA